VTNPAAYVVYSSTERVRIRIPEKRGDLDYFVNLRKVLTESFKDSHLQLNPTTGSVLFLNGSFKREKLTAIGKESRLFNLERDPDHLETLAQRVASPLSDTSRNLDILSGGKINLPELLFLGLLATGIYEIVRGNFRTPPWYTAFWYAFGVFSKSMIEKELGDRRPSEAASN